MKELKEVLLRQSKDNSGFSFMDAIKCIYQNEFGSEHMVLNEEYAYNLLKSEVKEPCYDDFKIEELGNNLVRFHLCNCDERLLKIIHTFFVKDSHYVSGSKESFLKKCELLKEIQKEEQHFLCGVDIDTQLNEYLKGGIVAVHHSKSYTQTNPTHYRLMSKNSAKLILACQKALQINDQKGSCIIAIDGKCTSGKSTVAELLGNLLNADIVHVDDFFLQPYQRNPERFQMIGGNFDYERLIKEVLEPLKKHELTRYQNFDCSIMQLNDFTELRNTPITIIEGSYSQHPILNHYYDLSIAMSINDQLQIERVLRRDGEEKLQKFIELWIPKENRYFETYNIFTNADYFLE